MRVFAILSVEKLAPPTSGSTFTSSLESVVI